MLWWLAQNTLVAAALAALVALVCRLPRPAPAWRHALWVVVLLKLLTPPLPWSWTVSNRWFPAEASVAVPSMAPNVSLVPMKVEMASPAVSNSAPPLPLPAPLPPVVTISAPTPAPVLRPEKVEPASATASPVPLTPEVPPGNWLARGTEAAWLASALAVALWHLRRVLRLRRLASWGRPAPEWLERQTAELAERVGVRPMRVRVIPGCGSPFLWCLGRPVLLVPERLLESLPRACWRGLLVHELAHLRRRDHWVSWLLLPAACLWWWSPLFWLVRRRVCLNAELACDAWVIGTLPEERRPFAEALIEVSRLISLATPAPALGMGAADRRAFERRLTMILHDRPGHRLPLAGLLAVGLFTAAVLPGWAPSQPPASDRAESTTRAMPALSPERALAKARVNGKYAMLLRQFKVEPDKAQYRMFADVGLRDVRTYAGKSDLSKGYWVYVYPYWYVWRDLASTPKPKRNWGPEQATGQPDTMMAGDIVTAWASRTPDEQDEWLMLEYAEPVVPRAVIVHETFNPGALVRVTAFKLDGTEVELWKGKDPTPVDEPTGMGVSVIPVKVNFKTNRVRIYLDSRNVPGWNEIDAVGLRDSTGRTQWATSADASSTYAELQMPAFNPPPALIVSPAETMQRLMRLEREVRELKKQNRDLMEALQQIRAQMKDKKEP